MKRKPGQITVEELNGYQREIRDLHIKHGIQLKEVHMPLHKGTHTIDKPIVLIKEGILEGV